MQKKALQEVLGTSAMNPYNVAKTRVRVDIVLPREFEVIVRMHEGSVLSAFIFLSYARCHH